MLGKELAVKSRRDRLGHAIPARPSKASGSARKRPIHLADAETYGVLPTGSVPVFVVIFGAIVSTSFMVVGAAALL